MTARRTNPSALRVFVMCLRALDYCPPVDISFGDFFRALNTADVDAVADDRFNYRVAIIEAFERRGIYPADVATLAVESLVWRPPRLSGTYLNALFQETGLKPEWSQAGNRAELWETMSTNKHAVRKWLDDYCMPSTADELGLALSADSPATVLRDLETGRPAYEVHAIRVARPTVRA